MNENCQPLVSVVTPVYNTEKYLAECIESIIAQTYRNWEYVNNEKFLDLMPNWNHAISLISPNSKYCKVVHADDWIFPECLEKMVGLAENNPSVGIVSAYRLDENIVNLDGLPYQSTVVSGREICRRSLLGGSYVFGSPTSILMRSDLTRKRQPFYNETHIHADKEACFDLLQESDFGFVHQVLTFTRRHNETETTFCKMYDTYVVGKLFLLKKYGPIFLNHQEYTHRLKRMVNNYHSYLVENITELKTKDFMQHHLNALKKMDVTINPFKLIMAFVKELLNPLNTVRKLRDGLKQRRFRIKND
jgi:glycosyltransferase involved in cell wall biosynthesis